MRKLTAVEEAKQLFEQAKDWGMWRWLTEKRRARRTADAAWEALETYEKKVKDGWDAGTREAFREDQALHAANRRAHKLRMDAEAQFDEADRRMSTEMARQGAQMAIDAWETREKFIRRLESFGRE
jgi:flagellar biosynthesis/type III secretory pathway protein FliH